MTRFTNRTSRGRALLLGVSLALSTAFLGGAAFATQDAPSNLYRNDRTPHNEPGTENLEDLRTLDPHAVPVSEQISVRIPILAEPGNPDSAERTDVQPISLAVGADGKYAYASYSSKGVHDLYVFDLQKRLHIATITSLVPGTWGGELVAAKEADVLVLFEGNNGVVAYDTSSNTEVARYPLSEDLGARVVISDDGKWLYTLSVASRGSLFHKINLDTGEVTDGPWFDSMPNGALAISPDGSTIAVGLGGGYDDGILTLIDTDTLAIVGGPYENKQLWQFEGLTYDSTGTALYTTAFSRTIARLSNSDGQNTSRITAGDGLASVLPVPNRDRAWAASYWENMIVVADFEKGVRSTSFRETVGGPNELRQARNGDLIVANGGGSGSSPNNSISILLSPRITAQPVNAEFAAWGDTVTFSASLEGVKADANSGVSWQSSADGVTWTDLAEYGTTLEVVADADAVALQYRMSFYDEFWAQRGVTDAVRIVGAQPVITSPVISFKTKVNEAIAPVTATATAQPGHSWSAEKLPPGLSIDQATGVISGTPTKEGSFAFTLTVTDAFGSASQDGSIIVTGTGGGSTGGDKHPPLVSTGAEGTPLLILGAGLLCAAGSGLLLARRFKA